MCQPRVLSTALARENASPVGTAATRDRVRRNGIAVMSTTALGTSVIAITGCVGVSVGVGVVVTCQQLLHRVRQEHHRNDRVRCVRGLVHVQQVVRRLRDLDGRLEPRADAPTDLGPTFRSTQEDCNMSFRAHDCAQQGQQSDGRNMQCI